MQKYEKKTKGAKKYTQALRKVKCTYAKKNYFISELNTAILIIRRSDFQC